jgi:hypothetical protein
VEIQLAPLPPKHLVGILAWCPQMLGMLPLPLQLFLTSDLKILVAMASNQSVLWFFFFFQIFKLPLLGVLL